MLLKLLGKFNKISEIAVMILMIAISIITFVQVIFRYVFNNSLFWSEEVGRYLLIWITFLGAAVGVNKGAHIGIDFIYSKIPDRYKVFFNFFINITGMIFGFLMLYYGTKLSYFVRMQKSSALLIPMSVPYSAVAVGGFLIFINYIIQLYHTIKYFGEKR